MWNQSVVSCPVLTVAYFLFRDGNTEPVKLKHLSMSDYVNTKYLTWSNSRPRFLRENMMLCFSAKKTISSSQCKETREMHRFFFFLSRRGGPWCKQVGMVSIFSVGGEVKCKERKEEGWK